MREFLDRVPGEGMANRKKITHEDGSVEMVFIENADNPIITGTPLNRDVFMDMQGFIAKEYSFVGSAFIETNSKGETLRTEVYPDRYVITFSGDKTITKTIFVENERIVREEIG